MYRSTLGSKRRRRSSTFPNHGIVSWFQNRSIQHFPVLQREGPWSSECVFPWKGPYFRRSRVCLCAAHFMVSAVTPMGSLTLVRWFLDVRPQTEKHVETCMCGATATISLAVAAISISKLLRGSLQSAESVKQRPAADTSEKNASINRNSNSC